jgi:hypothetical protein
MEHVRRKDLERAQLDMLSALREYLDWNCALGRNRSSFKATRK